MSTSFTGPARNLRLLSGFLIICASLFSGGCFQHYYLINSSSHIDSATLLNLVHAQKYFIVHDYAQKTAFALRNVQVKNDMLEADPELLLSEHEAYLHPARPDHNRYPVTYQDVVLQEVHLYAQTPVKDSGHLSIPLKDFDRIDVYQPDKKSTNKSTAGSIVGITLSTAAVVGIIAAISDANSKSTPAPTTQNVSCSPQVYLTDSQKTELQGTLYSGAVYASLERSDYLPLNISHPGEDKIDISVKGKNEEEIMVNRVQLVQVCHKENEQVLIDRKGKVFLYNNPVAPSRAIADIQTDMRKEILATDNNYYSFNNHPKAANSSDLLLDFEKPLNCSTGRLIINAKNSSWSYYLFNQFKSLYGDYYPTMIQKKDKADPEKVLQCELNQFLPILVSVKTKSGWKFVDYFPTSGNTKSRYMIMDLDLKEFTDSNHLQVRLQTTFMFWDLDYAGMDFSTNDSFRTSYIAADRIYIKKPNADTIDLSQGNRSTVKIGEREQLNLEFPVQTQTEKEMINSYFLSGTGYYHDNTPIDGKPRFAELIRFSGKGAFDTYSREKYDSWVALQEKRKKEMITVK
jgi:hypothetical protein